MLTITIQSDIMEAKRLFKSDRGTVSYLKKCKKLHDTHGEHLAGKKPRRSDFSTKKWFKQALDEWNEKMASFSMRVKIERLN